MQSGLRTVQIKRQKVFSTAECSFSLYFIWALRDLLLKCGGNEAVLRRSDTQDKHCLVKGDTNYIKEVRNHSAWVVIKFEK